ncbi:MAG: endo alpha-1,4 polygalactosaminidase [Anaerolineaceae bacterium]|nr:endo alpha-1,4 polygalactosaminidase [Anaerolineaceae bacterium]
MIKIYYFRLYFSIILIPLMVSCAQPVKKPVLAAPTSQIIKDDEESSLTFWTPSPGESFQIQLTDYPPDLSIDVNIFELDLFETPQNTIELLHRQGKKIICYINVGAWEDYRPDAGKFPQEVIGKAYDGWEGEYWLDISNFKSFKHIISARFDLAIRKNCDGIEADNTNGFQQNTGFSITSQDQLAYNIWLSEQAHKRGIPIGLKNNNEQVLALLEHYDFAVLEDCMVYDECSDFLPFSAQGKAVFQIEYIDQVFSMDDFCSHAISYNFTGVLKNRDLDAWVETCSSTQLNNSK